MEAQKRTDEEWRKLLALQEKSGLTQRAWCGANGINYGTFTAVIKRLRKKVAMGIHAAERKNLVGKWIELQGQKDCLKPTSRTGGIEVRIGKFHIVLQDTFSEEAFKRICRTLCELC